MKQVVVKTKFLPLVIATIATMGNGLTACSNPHTQLQTTNPVATDAGSKPATDHANMDHNAMDLGAADADFDLRFMNAMIPHHEGAVAMAKDALTKAQHPELRQLANEIIASQQAEIDQMKQWRKTWYGK
ncbi:hypothetical protein BST81_02055 [Leptolyngbya sp. 'hensonii']|uniref:DUF305 domain-containing protein n=1 Tax=Leptolyngbya sp. 'hensonii' TaxID=1922337 RepID=UPI00094F5ADD|nr:DUF305 domain-containing protein [Leptolyngbya sp. 'hensonii']OLP20044.1 hypothetical protein BST81_02055 [Leptolyngbya sp. 'hensonii']